MDEFQSFKLKLELEAKVFKPKMCIPEQIVVEVPVFDPVTMDLISNRLDEINGEVI